jgi:flagellar assembly protein FliH
MEIVINETRAGRHTIDKYKFKVFSGNANHEEPETSTLVDQKLEEPPVSESVEPTEHAAPKSSGIAHDELVESLLKKTDDVTSNFIKMQMKLEEMEASHKAALQQAKKQSFEEGVQAGRKALEEEIEQANQNSVTQFAESVKTLEKSAAAFEEGLGKVENELMKAAIDIAKEVIDIELSERGREIAKKLSANLIENLQSASSITLKVNPADHGAVSEHVGSMKHVTVMSDSAISRGGVVAISDAGNIDSQVMGRYERVKQAALSEG